MLFKKHHCAVNESSFVSTKTRPGFLHIYVFFIFIFFYCALKLNADIFVSERAADKVLHSWM